jgi:hypothetical protein
MKHHFAAACLFLSPFLAFPAATGTGKNGSVVDSVERAEKYSICISLCPPHETNGPALQKILKNEGYEPFAAGEESIVLVLDQKEIKKLFRAKIRFQKVAASGHDGYIVEPFLDGVVVSRRFKNLICTVALDPQQ